jgi:2-polyprenyl-3-methyl-5-hydroxy-6-metoxy-1,4-benzoquinol methylase
MTERATTSLPAGYFEQLYATSPDPWDFANSDYEAAKYAATLAALPRDRYPDALEIGCSIGVLTQLLAGRCDRLIALDAAEGALATARSRCAALPGVDLRHMAVPDDWPEGSFDLIMLSEVVYYLDRPDLTRLESRVRGIVNLVGYKACVIVRQYNPELHAASWTHVSCCHIRKASARARRY